MPIAFTRDFASLIAFGGLMVLALPFRANCLTRADLFRQIIRDQFDRWCDLRLDDEVSADQHAYARLTIQRTGHITIGDPVREMRFAGHRLRPGFRAIPLLHLAQVKALWRVQAPYGAETVSSGDLAAATEKVVAARQGGRQPGFPQTADHREPVQARHVAV